MEAEAKKGRVGKAGWLLLALLLGWLAGSAGMPQVVRAAPEIPAPPDLGDPQTPWRITADSVEYDTVNQVYTASGNVIIRKGERAFYADRITFDKPSATIDASGNVMVTSGADVLTGEQIILHLNTETGTLRRGRLYIEKTHFAVRADRIDKLDADTYRAYNATFTACEGPNPDWKITGKRMKVTVEGYGRITHAALWARNVPIFYTPFFIVPVKTGRQTGLLMPEFAYSDRRGAEYAQPFFWAIDDSADATVFAHYMSRRGLRAGAEYRFMAGRKTRGTLMLDYMRDEEVDDGTPHAERNWGYGADAAIRPDRDRYWFRAKHDQALPWGFSGAVDLDVVSDQDYLHEFQEEYAGFEETEDAFFAAFGRELDDYNDPLRRSRARLFRYWPRHSLYAGFRWTEDARRYPEGAEPPDETLQRLPYVRFDSVRQPIGDTPLLWRLESSYDYLYQEDGDRGHRIDLHPRVFWPLRLENYLTVEPSLGFRETVWYLDEFDPRETGDDRSLSRELFDFQLDLFTSLYRAWSGQGQSGLANTLRPRVVYSYIQEQRENLYPFFDETDRIRRLNRIDYSLTSIWTVPVARLPEDGGDKNGSADGKNTAPAGRRQVCRLKLAQSYDIEEAEMADPYAGEYADTRPFRPLRGEIQWAPGPWLNLQGLALQADAEWDVYDGRWLSRNISADLTDRRGDRLFAEYRYTRSLSETIYISLAAPVAAGLRVYGEYERNLHDDLTIRTGGGIVYESGCWSARLRYSDEASDRKVALTVNLEGLGGAD